jgi:hypothetical protein
VSASTPLAQTFETAISDMSLAGGFEANPRMRSQYLGPGWDLAHVRGTPYNTGECLEIAIRDISAKQAGQWSGCHSVAWDANAPANSGDREISNEFTKSGYPFGITINNQGVSHHFQPFETLVATAAFPLANIILRSDSSMRVATSATTPTLNLAALSSRSHKA